MESTRTALGPMRGKEGNRRMSEVNIQREDRDRDNKDKGSPSKKRRSKSMSVSMGMGMAMTAEEGEGSELSPRSGWTAMDWDG